MSSVVKIGLDDEGGVDQPESSIATMLREAAHEAMHSNVPEGFVWIEEYQQYYSQSSGYMYDPNTMLFYHYETSTYYYFDHDSQSYHLYTPPEEPLAAKWKSRSYKKKAKQFFETKDVEKMSQDTVDICELLFDMTDKLCVSDKPKVKRKAADTKLEEPIVEERFDEKTGEFYSVVTLNRDWKGEDLSSDDSDIEVLSDDDSEVDERVKLMNEEGFSQPPALRIIDSDNQLHVVTICGGTIGSSNECDIRIKCGVFEKLASFCYVKESKSYVVRRLHVDTPVKLNDYDLEASQHKHLKFNMELFQFDEDREIQHGDQLQVAKATFRICVHFGSNTCSLCEPGLLKSNAAPATVPLAMRGGETARRKTLKALKAAYGVNDYVQQPSTSCKNDRAAKRRKLYGSEPPTSVVAAAGGARPANPNDIYANCAAKPTPGNVRPMTLNEGLSTKINSENKGFKLLKSMGWQEGEGLGKEGAGRTEPVQTAIKNDRTGLGSASTSAYSATGKVSRNQTRRDILEITKKRFEEIKEDETNRDESN